MWLVHWQLSQTSAVSTVELARSSPVRKEHKPFSKKTHLEPLAIRLISKQDQWVARQFYLIKLITSCINKVIYLLEYL